MKIVLYSNNCPQCKVLKDKLQNNNIEFDICSDTNLMLSKGFKSVPMLEVDEEVMTYQEATKWINSINNTQQERA